jgi:hypothetical protein
MKKLLIACILALTATASNAANTILVNEYIKVGVNETTGTLGSGGNTSPGILYDATGTGTFNTSYDYLTPGSPFEGWSVRIVDGTGTLISQFHNNNASTTQVSGGAWIGTPTASSATWAVSNSSFDLTHSYSLPAGRQYLDITTAITANVAMPGIYFARFTDPDARAAAGDSSATDNVRGYGVVGGTNVVFSEATTSRYALGLYSAQATGVNTSISPGWSSNPADYYNHTSGQDVVRGDYTVGIGFYSTGLAIGDIVTYNYAYIFGPSAFASASVAIDGGAGGGTPGVAPGGGTLVDVGSATESGGSSGPVTPPAPTITGTVASTITVSDVTAASTILPVITASLAHHTASVGGGVQTIARETTTNVTTPMERVLVTKVRTTNTWSDGSTTFTDAAPVTNTTLSNSVATTVANTSFAGRIDQLTELTELNSGINRTLNSDAFRKDSIEYGKGRVYLTYNRLNSGGSNGYNADSDRYNVGYERNVQENWTVGAQYNYITTGLDGTDSTTRQRKNHAGVYSILTRNDWILKSDLGYARNDIDVSRTVENIFFNKSSNNGTDIWLSNRLYTPEIRGFRPYAGYVVGRNQLNGFTETGSIQSARIVGSQNISDNFAEAGVRFEKTISRLTLSADGNVTTDSYKTLKAEASLKVNARSRISLSATRQIQDNWDTNVLGLTGRLEF